MSVFSGIKLRKKVLRRLGERLISDAIIDEDQLRQALERQKLTGEFLGETLVSMGVVSPGQIGPYLEEVSGFPFVDLAEVHVEMEIARLIPENFARNKRVIPFKETGGSVHVAMADPLNLATVDELRANLHRTVVPYLAFANDVDDAVKRAYDVRHKAQSVLDEIPESNVISLEDSLEALVGLAEDAPIVRLVNSIVAGALSAGASDIHIEPQENNVRVRYRIDGIMYEQMILPAHHLSATVSRLKIVANLDIAERRRPQDGRFTTRDETGREFDVRLSIMPTVYGEKAVMRLLEKSNSHGTIDKVGFFPEQRAIFEKFIRKPHGIILVTGPTGSGKSTTLFAALQVINDSTRNINTIEDPVEYKLAGVNQMQVNPKIGVTFASGLRTLVRQDPDVILVGEIRDYETAEISIQAALTGHLVLSTLHTNDAPGALIRLQNMGVEPFLISSAVVGVLGQRLLRTICSGCKETYLASPEMVQAYGLPMEDGRPPLVARGRGCRRCNGRGMRGRTAVFEIMHMNDAIRDLVLHGASGAQLWDSAVQSGMMTMRQAGMRKVLDLSVAPEEAMRVLSHEE
jgi:type IV pilus assembly protein PilB